MEITENLQKIISQGDAEFSNRMPLLYLWQELALNFYPQRANFTTNLTLGEDFLAHLTSSIPVIIMRGLQSAIPSMLRPREKEWFKVTVNDEQPELNARQWLESANRTVKWFIYRKDSGFVRAVTQADADFMCFGNSVKYIDENKNRDGLMFVNIHLKDVCWFECESGNINQIHRITIMTAYDAIENFGKDRVHKTILEAHKNKTGQKFKIMHIVIKSDLCHDLYNEFGKKFDWVSLWVDVDNKMIIEKVGSYNQKYVIARWQTVSGFQYGYSPAAQVALPDARLLQSMMLTALEAGQKAVDPPMVATDDVVRGDTNLYAGGITLVDKDYDERLGVALRPIQVDKSGLNHALQMMDMIKSSLSDALYESKLNLPPIDATMTATEVMQRVKEYARTALPLFTPIEEEDNAVTIDITFDILLRNGAFGYDIPESLAGQDIKFEFMSPIQDSNNDMIKGQYGEMLNIAGQTMKISPDATVGFDIPSAFNYLMDKTGIPSQWIKSKEEMQAELDEKNKQKQILEASQMAQQVGAGGQALQGALGG